MNWNLRAKMHKVPDVIQHGQLLLRYFPYLYPLIKQENRQL